MDSMDDASAVPWSGSAFLASVGGTADAFPPARVLFLISRLRTSGRIWLTHLADIRTIDFTDGEVVACSGFSDLLKEIGVSGEYGEGLADMLTRAVADGHSEEQVAKVAAQALGTWMVEHTGDTGLIVQFAPDSPAPDLPLAQPICTMKVLLEGIQACRDEDWVRSWLDVHQDAQPAVCIPSDRPRSEWGLGVMDISVLGALETATEMSAVASLGTMNWATLATMIDLGLLGVSESTQAAVCPPSATASEPPVVESEPSKPQPSIGFTIPSEVTKEPSATPSVSRPRTKRTGQKFLPVDATKALAREPWQSPPELMEEHLSEAYRAMNESASETVFGLTQTAHLSQEFIDGRFRDLCARYHPDRYLGANQAVRSLAQGCFSRVADAHQKLKQPEYLERLNARFIYAETGKKPVTERTRTKARVDFKKAELLFRQRRFPDAAVVANRAHEGDPDRGEYLLLYVRSAWNAREMETDTAVEQILELKGMGSRELGEAYYQAGEMLLRDKRAKEATKLFRKSIETDSENIGARRRIRLEERRLASASTDKAKPARGGVLGGLFGRRKR